MSASPLLGNCIRPVGSQFTQIQDDNASYLSSPNVTLANDPQDIITIIKRREKSNYHLGILLLVIAIVTWLVGLELISSVIKGDDYQKPIFMSVFIGANFCWNFVPEAFLFIKGLWLRMFSNHIYFHTENDRSLIEEERNSMALEELTRSELLSLTLQLTLIYLVYNFCQMKALEFTSPSNSTVLGSLTSIFTLVIGRILGIELFSTKKVICIVASVSGVFLIYISEESREKESTSTSAGNSILGNLLGLGAAFMYCLYLTVMRIKCDTNRKTTDPRLLFGYIGVSTVLIGIPVLLIAHVFHIERFELPIKNSDIMIALVVNGISSAISDYTTILASGLTSPLVASLCLTSSIPITIFVDYVLMQLGHSEPINVNLVYFIGVVNIIGSVALINVNFEWEEELVEEVIERTLSNSVIEDYNMIPIISPLLSPRDGPADLNKNIHPNLFKLYPYLAPNVGTEVSRFDLSGRDATNGSTENLQRTSSPRYEDEHRGIIVYESGNHNYSLKLNPDH